MFFRRRLGAFDASASLGSLGVSFFFSAIFPFFFSFSEISLPSWGFFLCQEFLFLRLFISFYFETVFISFLSGISSYEFIVFSLSFFFLSLFASESETERQKKDFDEWNSFPSIIFHPLALSWFLSPRENPYPLRTDGFTSHWHVVARDKRPTNMLSLFLFARKTLLFFFLFSNSRKKRLVRYENFARYGLVVIATEAFCFYRASGADVTSSVELCRITTICCLICILRGTCSVLRSRFYRRNYLPRSLLIFFNINFRNFLATLIRLRFSRLG